MNAHQRAYSIIELMVVVAFILLGLGAVIVQMHPQSGGGQSCRGMALMVAGELRNARLQALNTRSTQAVCIPGNNATTPCAQSLYVMSGHGHTAPRRIIDYTKDFPGGYLFVGMWPQSSGAKYTIDNPRYPPFNVSAWTKPQNNDYIFAFTPDGRVHTNDVGHVQNGNYCILVSDGPSFTAAATPPGTPTAGAFAPGYFTLNSADQPYTISITPSGSVSVTQGVVGADSTVVQTNNSPKAPTRPAAPAPLISNFDKPPVVDSVSVLPAGNPSNAGFTTTVSPRGQAALTLLAYDPDGDTLTYSWTATGGNFTYPPSGRTMTYDSFLGLDKSVVNWFPPYQAVPGSAYRLNATVTDPYGQSVTTTGNASVLIGVLELGRILFQANNGDEDVYIMNGDGTAPARMTKTGGFDGSPDLSSNGLQVTFVSDRGLKYFDNVTNSTNTLTVPRIWAMNADGTNVRNLTNVNGTNGTTLNATVNSTDSCPAWSIDGGLVAFARTNAGQTKIQVIDLKGKRVGTDLDVGTAPNWSPTGVIVYEKTGVGLYTMSQTGGSSIKQLTNNAADTKPVWSGDGKRVLFLRGSDLWEVKADGTGAMAKLSGWGGGRISFRPNGTQFIGVVGNKLMRVDDPGLGKPAVNLVDITPAMFTPVLDTACSWGPSMLGP